MFFCSLVERKILRKKFLRKSNYGHRCSTFSQSYSISRIIHQIKSLQSKFIDGYIARGTKSRSSSLRITSKRKDILSNESFFLLLQRNDFSPSDCEAHEKTQYLLKNRRDPIFKSRELPDESASAGRDTVGTAHSRSRTGLRLFYTFTYFHKKNL